MVTKCSECATVKMNTEFLITQKRNYLVFIECQGEYDLIFSSVKCQEKNHLGIFVIWGGNFILGIYHHKIISWHVSVKACILKGVYHVSLLCALLPICQNS